MAKSVTTTKKVKETINSNPGKTKKELAGILGIKDEAFTYHYQKLLKAGEIQKIEDQIVMNAEVIKNLESYFVHGFTDEEACLQANISTRTLYDYCKNNPEWADRRQTLKKSQYMTAKLLVSQRLKDKKDDYIKMVYQEEKRQERSKLKIDLGVSTEDEENLEIKSVGVRVTFLD